MEEYDKWERNAWTFERMDTLTFTQYRELLLKDLEYFHQKLAKIEQPAFRAMMEDEIGTDPTSRLMRYAWSKPRKDKVFADWMNSFDRNDSGNFTFAFDYLRWYERENLPSRDKSYGVQHLANMKKLFDSQEIINALAADYMQKYLPQAKADIEEVWQAFQQTTTDKTAVEKLRPQYEHYTRFLPGKLAPDFEMTGVDGKIYHLSDFRGKALYIDIWATWCKPCCYEIPFIKEIEHRLKDKNIVFVSISKDKDLDVWKNYVKNENMGGLQLNYGRNSDFMDYFYITGIPRFIIIDPNQKIVTARAPKPSSGELEVLLNNLLN